MFHNTSFWSAQGLAHVTIGLNIASFFIASKSLDNAYSISDNNSVGAMLVSMFTHVNAQHLVGNMLSLLFTSQSVFVNAEWNSPWAFLLIYIPSGLAGFLGNSLLVQMQQKRDKQTSNPSWTIDSMSRWMTSVWNGSLDYQNVQEKYFLWRRAAAKRVGASGAVYGVVGARIYAAMYSPYHAPLNANDYKTLLCLIGEELPQSFDMATTSMVDHAAHLFGFVTGMATAWMWDKWSTYYRRRKQYSRGRKLGGTFRR